MAEAGLLVETPISIGELLDKITILEIKLTEIKDETKLGHVRKEHELLSARRDSVVPKSPELDAMTDDLARINRALWDVEDVLRDMERAGTFGADFVANARAVYKTNDERARIKSRINDLTGSALSEQKSYAAY